MKKITSLALAVFMVVSMLAVSFTSASAAVGIDFSKTGSIKLTKYEAESDKSIPVDGATFKAYKVFDLVQNSGTTESTDEGTFKVTEPFSGVDLSAIKLPDTVSSGNQDSQGYLFTDTDEIEKIIPKLEAVTTAEGSTATGIEFAGEGNGVYTVDNLSLGIYLIVETEVPAVDAENPDKGWVISSSSFLVTVPFWDADNEDDDNEIGWDYSVDASPKDDPMIIKKVFDNGIIDNQLDSFNIGEKIPYKVTSSIPNYGESVRSTPENPIRLTDAVTDDEYNSIVYRYKDTFTKGLTFNYDSTDDFKVYLKSDNTKVLKPASDASTPLKKRGEINDPDKADYKLTKTNNGFVLDVAWEALDAYQGDDLVLEYSATLNEEALIEVPEENLIDLEYKPNPSKETTKIIESKTKSATYELHLDKKFNNKSAAEAGVSISDNNTVSFKISKTPFGSYIPVKKVSAGNYVVWDFANNKYVTGSTLYEMNVDTAGKLVLKGLKDGTYYLEETKTVSGFGKLKSKVKIVVSEKTSDPDKIVDCNAQSYTSEGTAINLPKLDKKIGTFVVTINNTKNQFSLPQTGGLGLWIFTIAGGVVMAGAIIFFAVIRKKKRNQ